MTVCARTILIFFLASVLIFLQPSVREMQSRNAVSALSPTVFGGFSGYYNSRRTPTELVIDSDDTLTSLPDELGEATSLRLISIHKCRKLTLITERISRLKILLQLKLRYCTALTSLPRLIGEVSSLVYITLEHNTGLTELPPTIGQLEYLTMLNLSGCTAITRLPDSLCDLSSLNSIFLCGCSGLTELPPDFGRLEELGLCNLSQCTALTALPASIGQIVNMRRLIIEGCENLHNIPISVGNLACLEWFGFDDEFYRYRLNVESLQYQWRMRQNMLLLIAGCYTRASKTAQRRLRAGMLPRELWDLIFAEFVV